MSKLITYLKSKLIPSLKSNSNTILLIVVLVVIVLVGLLLTRKAPVVSYVLTVLLMTWFVILSSKSVTGLYLGVLIDERNSVSLSRLQMIGWTIVVLSALFTAGLGNVTHGSANALNLQIPTELWILLGISTVSLVGSPLIKVQLAGRQPKAGQATPTKLKALGLTAANLQGVLVKKKKPEDAVLKDLFAGEQVGNFQTIDIGKVQLFFFTAILLLVYGAALCRMFSGAVHPVPPAQWLSQFPSLSEGMVFLIGISHGGYLTYKALPR